MTPWRPPTLPPVRSDDDVVVSYGKQQPSSYRTNGDVLLPLAHVGAVLQRGASALPEVPATVGVPRLQAEPAAGKQGK